MNFNNRFQKWENINFKTHIKFNNDSGFLDLEYGKIDMPNTLNGYTFRGYKSQNIMILGILLQVLMVGLRFIQIP